MFYWNYLAPWDGTEIKPKTLGIYGVFDFDWIQIPSETPLQKGGGCRTLSDDGPSVRFPKMSTLN